MGELDLSPPGNPWLERRVFHWAHQGGAREAPSNTLLAMREAVERGAHGLEVDVHLSSDGEPVLIHDATVERTTDGTGAVAEKTLAELRELDAAHWWVPGKVDDHDPATPPDAYPLRRRPGGRPTVTVATLDELLEAFPGRPLTIEIKAAAAVGPTLEALARHRRSDEVIVSSFKERIVRRLLRDARHLPLAPGRVWTPWFWLRSRVGWVPRRTPYAVIQVPHRKWGFTWADRKLVECSHRAGMAVHVWTIDDEDEMRHLVEVGVDGVMTDRPSVLARVLAGSGH